VRGLFSRWVASFLAVLFAGWLIPGLVTYQDWQSAAVFAVLLAFLNAYIRPILILLTLPVGCLTLGLFTLVINAFLFWVATAIFTGVEVSGFVGAFIAALLVSLVSFTVNRLAR